MPRKRKMLNQSLRYKPLTFSPFGRSMALVSCLKKTRHNVLEVQSKANNVPISICNGSVNLFNDKKKPSDSSDDEDFKGIVQAEFVFSSPEPEDFHALKLLLQTYLGNKQWGLSGFVDLVLEQSMVGTLIKIPNDDNDDGDNDDGDNDDDDDDDAVFSVVSVLNLERYKDFKCIIEIKDYLLKVCQETDVMAKLKPLLGVYAADVGLIVSQHMVNIPCQLLPPLYDDLFNKIDSAMKDENSVEELRNSFRFKTYIIISRIYKHKNADQIQMVTRNGDEAILYYKPEDEILLELCSWSFCFPLHAEQVSSNELKNHRLMGLVMAVEASKVGEFRNRLHSLIDKP